MGFTRLEASRSRGLQGLEVGAVDCRGDEVEAKVLCVDYDDRDVMMKIRCKNLCWLCSTGREVFEGAWCLFACGR